ncbi:MULTISPECIES: hypothetical protein [Bacteroidales]|uniref:Uncharacterized protein n=1 Tax=Porphyromonas loveana TaxID=1884669 RepID=A0A2U1FSV9_9PORP|nr:hypothetical protein [Porphyromonas loveana]PVZ15264.1 hypothetical protein C7382_101199 [Porphyromonas loveana]
MKEKDKKAAPAKKAKAAAPKAGKARNGAVTEEVYAAIAMALYQEAYEAHDTTPMKLTINRRQSGWALKSLLIRQLPK